MKFTDPLSLTGRFGRSCRTTNFPFSVFPQKSRCYPATMRRLS